MPMPLDQSVFSVEELSLAITSLPTRIGNRILNYSVQSQEQQTVLVQSL